MCCELCITCGVLACDTLLLCGWPHVMHCCVWMMWQVMNMIKTNTGTLELIVHIKNNTRAHASAANGSASRGSAPVAPAHAPKGGFAMRNTQHEKLIRGDFATIPVCIDGYTPEVHCAVALLDDNRDRNRYVDILPYDDTRVKLQAGDSDYFNGNHVGAVVHDRALRWIACQGPLASTAADFWQMVWEQRVSVVCMLTALFESKPKCFKYWPDARDDFGDFTVALQAVEQQDGFVVRTFNVTRSDSFTDGGRTVYHCHFQGWPDHGVPDDPAVFLRYVAHVQHLKAVSRATAQPTVLHCSAGIGRTGVFMLAELGVALLQRNEARVVDPWAWLLWS
eukprot:m.1397551 g.1397551  ORF g.1397551 m.1397551 type:complete len:336 (+) comp24998_c0_seq1:8-1015(+)